MAAVKRVPIEIFVLELLAALKRGDGYIMGAYGQNPRTGHLSLTETDVKSSWKPSGWYYTQYSGRQRTQALKWREKCTRVWDCNGMAEGIYQLHTGVCINSKARYNYRDWCDPKGKGMIPAAYRVPGAAVFWSDGSSSSIHHVAYLVEPVVMGHPEGDWYMIEARGVMYGVVKTKLYSRKPNFWGWMTKYFDYAQAAEQPEETEYRLGDRLLRNGSEGEDVKTLQDGLLRLGYDLGKWGADGDYGDCTELAVRAFQKAYALDVDGIAGPLTVEALEKALAALENDQKELPESTVRVQVVVNGGSVYVRSAPELDGAKLGVVHRGDRFPWQGQISEKGWLLIEYQGQNAWISGKYAYVDEGT